MNVRGGFSTYSLSSSEKDTFAEYLQHSMNSPALEFIKYLLGDDYIKFIDVMSGTTLKIPSAKSLEHDLELVRIFLYVKRHGFTEISIKEAAKSYGKSVLTTRRYVLKVAKVLGIEDLLEGDDLNNYITYIKSVEQMDSYYITKLEAKQDELHEKRRSSINGSVGVDNSNACANVTQQIEVLKDMTVEQYCDFNKENKYIEIIKEIQKQYQEIQMQIKLRKVGNYIRITYNENNSLADCTLNKSGWNVDFYYADSNSRDKSMKTLHNYYNTKVYGKRAITIRGLKSEDDFKYILNTSLSSFKEMLA